MSGEQFSKLMEWAHDECTEKKPNETKCQKLMSMVEKYYNHDDSSHRAVITAYFLILRK